MSACTCVNVPYLFYRRGRTQGFSAVPISSVESYNESCMRVSFFYLRDLLRKDGEKLDIQINTEQGSCMCQAAGSSRLTALSISRS